MAYAAKMDASGETYDDDSRSAGPLFDQQKGSSASPNTDGTTVMSTIRTLLLVSLALLGAFSSITTYRYMRDDAEDEDRSHQLQDDEFGEYAERVFTSLGDKLELQLSALDSFAGDIFSYAHHSQTQWPQVTLPDFEMLASKARSIAGSTSVSFLPVVTQRKQWENYSVSSSQGWLQESIDYLKETTDFNPEIQGDSIRNTIWNDQRDEGGFGPFLPLWQTSPIVLDVSVYNFDVLSHPNVEEGLKTVLFTGNAAIGKFLNVDNEGNGDLQSLLGTNHGEPQVAIFYPIFDSFSQKSSNLVGVLFSVLPLGSILVNVIPEGHVGEMTCILENSAGQVLSYSIGGNGVTYLGSTDLHDSSFDLYMRKKDILKLPEEDNARRPLDEHYLKYSVRVYPSSAGWFKNENSSVTEDGPTGNAAVFATLSAFGFAFVMILFLVYDCLVEKEKTKFDDKVARSTPSTVSRRDVEERMFQAHDEPGVGIEIDIADGNYRPGLESKESSQPRIQVPASKLLNNYLKDETECYDEEAAVVESKPIADFFPNCTVLFADIVGFTAWSSQHEPTQVFMLLQELYQAFDKEAKKRGVFKIESIGDSYVAVTGLPDPQQDHAVRMATFCLECRKLTKSITRKLEKTLGPETAELGMRFGLHSGPVTAGVMQGERSRFQLFGDTVNTAGRMGSSGHKGLVQASESTALLLIEADRGSWVSQREETTTVVGKGEMVTYWVDESEVLAKKTATAGRRSTMSLLSRSVGSSLTLSGDDSFFEESTRNFSTPRRMLKKTRSRVWGKSEVNVQPNSPRKTMKKRSKSKDMTQRLINWNVETLLGLLKQMAAKRASVTASMVSFDGRDLALRDNMANGKTVLDEVAEIITMPTFNATACLEGPEDADSIEISSDVESQLRSYITSIASMYRDNPFHSYEHACHVQMAMIKLLQRVVAPSDVDYEGESAEVLSDVHKYTYGITSDPLTSFAVVFCALVHDVDHTGVTNGQLIKEGAHIATVYKNKSVAEQNSIDLAWDLLMGDEYKELRSCIYTTMDEFKRFRQLVVNVILATDIFDKELSALRKNRWAKAFTEYNLEESERDYVNRKATIVIEHLIQASDVSHTMQHWDIYRKWNQKLFYEMYLSYTSGRTDSDPSEGWYRGELWFFDNYVIPLAKKLKDCGVFGVSSDECLNYAEENRNMWKAHGEEIVKEMKETDYFATLKARKRKSTG